MSNLDKIVALASVVKDLDPDRANAAALLIDAAALCASDCGVSLDELIERLKHSHTTFVEATHVFAVSGNKVSTRR